MKIFVSSLITGMEAERAAVKRAIGALGHEPVMAEAFVAKASSPQIACLQGVHQSDLVLLILGDRYGAVQPSGLSATHEEYREARGSKPILAFIKAGAVPDPQQAAFIHEAGTWEGGSHRVEFSNADALADAATRAMHSWELAHAVAPLNPDELRTRALALLPATDRHTSSGRAALSVAIAAGPTQSVLRPAELEATELADTLQQEATFGPHRIFDKALGAEPAVLNNSLVIQQKGQRGTLASLTVLETGDMLIQLPPGTPRSERAGFAAIIEEDVRARLTSAVGYAGWLLDKIDPTQRLTHVAIAVRLAGEGYCGWRTEKEQAASPNGGSMSMVGMEDQRDQPVLLNPPHRVRAALSMDAARIVDDLVVLLRRRWKSRD